MDTNKDIDQQPGNGVPISAEIMQMSQLYLSTCEMLARYAFDATAAQQQMNIVAQQVTVNGVRALYAGFTQDV